MRWIKKAAFFLTIIMLVSIVFSGCAVRRIPSPGVGSDITTPDNNYNKIPYGSNYSPKVSTPTTAADNIAKAVKTVPGIKGASAVISGNNAYVGINIDVSGNIDNTAKVQNLKKQAADMVRKTDNSIKTIYVSADADFVQRLTRISNDIKNGKPVEGFTNELTQLVKRMTPERQ